MNERSNRIMTKEDEAFCPGIGAEKYHPKNDDEVMDA